MGKFASGLITGGALGAIGLAIAVSDRRTRKKMLKDGRKAMHKANNFMNHM